MNAEKSRTTSPTLAKQILVLAIPALGALIAEPLFLMADSAIVGHLGVSELAGAALGTTVLHTAVGLMIFLAYATTPAVARALGAGQQARAMAAGRDGMWFAVVLGIVLSVAGFIFAEPLVRLMGGEGQTLEFAVDYILYSMPGLTAMLLVLAATGVLRGMQDTKTPLVVATAGFGLNIVLNFGLVYGLQMSVAGAALGTSIAQWLMALVYLWMLVPRIRAAEIHLRPSWAGFISTGQVGSWLMLRNLTMRVALLLTVVVATNAGELTLAAHQLVFTIFSFLAFALDALAIAAQALIGKELGAGDASQVRQLTGIMSRWGIYFGIFTGLLLLATSWVFPTMFTPDTEVHRLTTLGLWILAISQPLCGLVFVLDGVLIGAGDAKYLGIAGTINLLAYLPMLWAVQHFAIDPQSAILWIWVVFAIGYMLARAITLGLRARGDAWMRLGQ
ncbi:MATE family efflux transporter [Arthrobacter sp. MYb229]|uniref:MATE family efflux transporter n=1 Tax=unclassified Arthrobacter TaxID=235627 RepID=UPI000CFB0BD5|nr:MULTISPECIES: MATE family efflux transporter [unclassified Arthrobacter]PRA04464.1 MATE family efflux transporter [Arthrobacter sp. MYb229]PRB51623.1 MATE family efflux transporter [Arthrobacter sp. MYb216]